VLSRAGESRRLAFENHVCESRFWNDLEEEVDPGIPGGRTLLSHIDRELNLKGKICPYAFVESMLAMEEMENGQVLRVIVDYPTAACDVPQSLKGEGYEILDGYEDQ